MSKHEELIERLRCFDRVTCNEAADALEALEAQALEIEGLRKQDEALIRQMLEALKQFQYRACESIHPDFVDEAITAGRARLELPHGRCGCEALRKDAERYRAFIDCGQPICFLGEEYFGKDALDAAIDAAKGALHD